MSDKLCVCGLSNATVGSVVLHTDHLASHAYDEAVERAAFEAAFKRHKLDRQDDDGFYVELYVDALWQGWFSCAKSRAKRAGGAE